MKLTKKQQYMIDNDLIEPPKCEMCDELVTWSNANGGYFPTRCNKCRKIKLTKEQQYLKNNGLDQPPKCKMCDELVKWTFDDKGRYQIYCSDGCRKSDYPHIVEKSNTTYTHKTGYNNPRKDPGVVHKIKQSYFNKTGFSHPSHNPNVLQQRKQTHFDKTGFYHPMTDPMFVASRNQIHIENTGYTIHTDPVTIAKRKQTYFDKTGYQSPLQNPEVREKIALANQTKYGCEYPNQRHIIDPLVLLNNKEWLCHQYHTQQKTLTQISRELGVGGACVGRYASLHGIEIRPTEIGSSRAERQWIDSIMESEGIYIQHGGNGGQYKIPVFSMCI